MLALIGLFGRGLNLGIEFKGGSEFTVPDTTASVEDVRATVEGVGIVDPHPIAGQKRCCMEIARPLRQMHHEYSSSTLLRCVNPCTSTRSWCTWSCPGE